MGNRESGIATRESRIVNRESWQTCTRNSGSSRVRPRLSCSAIDLVLASKGLVPVNGGGDILIGEFEALQRALNHWGTKVSGERAAEFEFRAPAESFFASPVAPVAAHAHAVDARMHALVDYGGRYWGGRDVPTREEGELGDARALVRDPGPTAGESDDADLVEVAPEVTQAPRLVALDQRERLVEASEHVRGRDVRSRVLDRHWNAANYMRFNSSHCYPTSYALDRKSVV